MFLLTQSVKLETKPFSNETGPLDRNRTTKKIKTVRPINTLKLTKCKLAEINKNRTAETEGPKITIWPNDVLIEKVVKLFSAVRSKFGRPVFYLFDPPDLAYRTSLNIRFKTVLLVLCVFFLLFWLCGHFYLFIRSSGFLFIWSSGFTGPDR